jgi:hypothetical protein
VRAAGEGGRRKVVEELATVPFHRTHQYIYFQRHRCCAELLQRQKLVEQRRVLASCRAAAQCVKETTTQQ